jgi:TPR repeat protein
MHSPLFRWRNHAVAKRLLWVAAALSLVGLEQPAWATAQSVDGELARTAEHGDARAQYRLGMMNLSGEIPASNSANAARWFRLAAEQGLPEAQRILGNLYAEGIGVSQNDSETIKWYRLAADQGDAVSQYYLAHIYVYSSANRNLTESVKWYQMAAAQGYIRAQLELAHMYKYGIGVPRDLVKSYIWNSAAASRLEYLQASSAGTDRLTFREYGLAYRGPSPVPHAGELLEDAASSLTPEQLATGKAAAERCQQSNYRDCG